MFAWVLTKRLLLSESRTAQDLCECRCRERIAALLIPLHIQRTSCNAMYCSNHQLRMQNTLPRMRQWPQGKEYLEFLSKCRPEACLEPTYLIMCGRRTTVPTGVRTAYGSLVAASPCGFKSIGVNKTLREVSAPVTL